MKTDPLETRMRQVPLRSLPAEWRSQILSSLDTPEPAAQPRPVTRRGSALRGLAAWFQRALCPTPLGWSAVATAWVCIVLLNTSGPRSRAGTSPAPHASPQAQLRAIRNQSSELTRILANSTDAVIAPPRRIDGPRSESPTLFRYV